MRWFWVALATAFAAGMCSDIFAVELAKRYQVHARITEEPPRLIGSTLIIVPSCEPPHLPHIERSSEERHKYAELR